MRMIFKTSFSEFVRELIRKPGTCCFQIQQIILYKIYGAGICRSKVSGLVDDFLKQYFLFKRFKQFHADIEKHGQILILVVPLLQFSELFFKRYNFLI